MNIKELQRQANEYSRKKGFWELSDETRSFVPLKLALIHSEISEALEEYRKGFDLNTTYLTGDKPEGFGVELADAVIRIADLAEQLGIDLEPLIAQKMEYNRTRPHKHGKIA